jgi:hypothetical protein
MSDGERIEGSIDTLTGHVRDLREALPSRERMAWEMFKAAQSRESAVHVLMETVAKESFVAVDVFLAEVARQKAGTP